MLGINTVVDVKACLVQVWKMRPDVANELVEAYRGSVEQSLATGRKVNEVASQLFGELRSGVV